MNATNFTIRAYYKSELSQMYCPQVKVITSLRTLNRWINASQRLTQALDRLGYNSSIRLLTPGMVRVIVEHLGEP